MTALLVAAVAGYLLGAVSPATLWAHHRGADLRASGSGNPGATNVGRVLGRKAGIAVGLLDVAKGFGPALAFSFVSHEAGLVAGFAAVLGHVSSPFLRGRGGKGVATAAGAILGSHPWWALVVLLVWVGVVLLTRWVALGSAVSAAVLPGLATRSALADVLWALAITGVVLFRHRVNFVRWWRTRSSTDPV